jgi:hypothetical protein
VEPNPLSRDMNGLGAWVVFAVVDVSF